MRKDFLFIIFITGIMACNKTVDLPDFDEERWKIDKNGCSNVRVDMADQLVKAKDHLKGLTEEEIVLVLGRPDKHELYKRNQKFFIYEIDNAPACSDYDSSKTHTFFSIRYNATGRAKEIMIYRD